MTSSDIGSVIKEAAKQSVIKVNQKIKSKGMRIKNALRNAELEVLGRKGGKRSGKKYNKPFSKRRYTASAPGEPPARRTGALRLNWTGGTEGGGNTSGGGMRITAYIESNTPYAGYLEYGTSKMAARPYVERIKETAKPEIERIVKEQ